ncbi:MAG: alkene reductase [Caenispirillum bisanense]|nr:alkene reductase [Caenispirillum bisanense]MCA1971645.1 alkene reductase [Caenispirillum sp.]
MTETSDILFRPHRMGAVTLPNRVAMAPMTRSRAAQPGDVPTELTAAYYAQRAGAGVIVSEGTQVSRVGQGYAFTPGIYSPEQTAGWKKVTDAVHAKGGRIYAQLWHVGRVSHPLLHGEQPVAPSAVNGGGQAAFVVDDKGPRMEPSPVPRALSTEEVRAVVQEFAQAARNAKAAGFDGVELHGANGYLIEQFLRAESNQRTDVYGGSLENRLRFLAEVTEAVAGVFGADRVGVRISPFLPLNGIGTEEDPAELFLAVATMLDGLGVAYLHTSEASPMEVPPGTDPVPQDFRRALRQAFRGTIMVAGGYDGARARAILETGLADVVAFGRPYIANPDLAERLARDLPWADADRSTFYGGGEHGYTDYPAHADAAE